MGARTHIAPDSLAALRRYDSGLSGPVCGVDRAPASSPRFHTTGNTGIDSIEGAHAGLERLVGGGAALGFAVALLASGGSSSSVGTYAGQVLIQGFINRRIPLFVRRAVTMTPALIILALGLDPTSTTTIVGGVVAALIIILNGFLLHQTFLG